jgi:hypothetical protein
VKLKKHDQALTLGSKVGLLQKTGRTPLAASNGRV